MTLPAVDNALYQTPDEVLAQLLADVNYNYAQAGLTCNVAKGSELYYRYKAIANRISVAFANNEIALRNYSPLSATGDELETLAAVFGVTKRAASSAQGNIIVGITTGSVAIPAGHQCTSAGGIQYQVITTTTVSDGDTVAVQAVSAGANTDLDAAEIVTWDSAALGNLEQTATVDPGGIDGGADADDDDALRTRLLYRLQWPAVGGNWSQVAQWCEEASAGVQAAFVYPAARGPASYDVCVVADDHDRVLSTANVNSIAAYMLGRMPGFADLNCTTCNPQYVDVIIDLTLPLPVNAGGAGGGWRDADPWPSTDDSAGPPPVLARVADITNIASRQITVDSTNADTPVAGKRFGVWIPATATTAGEMREYTIESVGGVSGAYVLTIAPGGDSLTGIVVGSYCSAGAHNLKAYADAFADWMQGLGPGEKTTNVDIIPRALRKPPPDVSFPASLTSLGLASISNDYSEVLNATYQARYATGTTNALTAPSTPTTAPNEPRILVLSHLSFRRQV